MNRTSRRQTEPTVFRLVNDPDRRIPAESCRMPARGQESDLPARQATVASACRALAETGSSDRARPRRRSAASLVRAPDNQALFVPRLKFKLLDRQFECELFVSGGNLAEVFPFGTQSNDLPHA